MQNGQPRLTESDIKNAKDVFCESCNNNTFTNVFVIKRIPALLSSSGQDVHIPIPTFACTKCSHINKNFLPPEEQRL